MARLISALLLTIGCATAVFAEPPPSRSPAPRTALVDSLLAWRDAHRPDRVDSLAGPAIATARAAGDTTELMFLLLIRGATRAGFGLARSAEDDLEEGIALATARADTLRRLQCLRWLSVAVGRQGRTAEAAELYGDLEVLAHAAGDSLHLGWAWVGMAYDHYLQGRAAQAGETYARAAGLLDRFGETSGAIWAWNGRGLALRQAGRYREARAAFARVLALTAETGDVVNEATALDQLGRLDLQLGDPGQAVALFKRSAAIHRAHQHHREGLVPSIDLATALLMQGRYPEAEATLDSVLAVCRKFGLRDLELLAESQLVDAWLDQDRPGMAAAHCRAQLAGGEMPSRLASTEIRLRLARALTDRDSLTAAIAVLDDIQSDGVGAVSLELRTAGLKGALLVDCGRPQAASQTLRPAVAAARAAGSEAELVVLLTHLGRAEQALDRPDSALAIYARAIACWERVRAWPTDPVWREQRGLVSGSLFAHAVAARLGQPDGLAAAWTWAQRHKARTLQERMLGPGATARPPTAPNLAEFRRQALRPGEVFLDLIEGERLGVMFCVTRDTAFAGLLPGRRQSEPRLRRLADLIRSPDIDDPRPAQRLATDLVDTWPSLARDLAAQAQAVAWSPDGSWHQLPAALLDWPGALTRVPAAGVRARLHDRSRPQADTATILAIGGPAPAGGEPLPGAAREVGWLRAQLRDVRRGQDTGSRDHPAWAEADILHFATHTLLDVHQPWNTCITLHTGPDGSLRAADVAELELNARLAVLAGCTTVGKREIGGEGLVGLACAFLAARTPAVLATLWPVDDAVAFEVTTSFYTGLAEGLTAAAALDRTRRRCRSGTTARAPRHWAGFVLVGDGDVSLPVRRRTPRWPWALGLGALAVLAWARARS
jgi:tetratricopeptide (TPR) repeat protein